MRKLILTSFLLFTFFNIKSQVLPTDIQGLVHWYSADSVAKDANGLVEIVYDLSQNNDHLTQINPLNRPQYLDSVFYNRPIIRFNGIDESMESIFSQNIQQPFTVFTVWKTLSNGTRVFLDDRSNVMIDIKNGAHVRMFSGGELFYSKPSPFDYIITHAEFNSSSSTIYENNVLRAQGSIGNGSLPGITMGKRTLYNDRFFHGDFSQLLIFEGVLSQEQIDMVNSYLYDYYIKFVDLGGQVFQDDICDTITLYAGDRFESYLWSDGTIADSMLVSSPGLYWVEVVDAFGYTSRDTIEVVTGFQNPNTQIFCQNESLIWNPELHPAYNYLWSDGSTADSLVINSPGSYHVTVTDTNGCVFKSDTLSFQEDVFPTSASLGPDLNLCSGNNLSLTSGASEAVSYLWNTGSTEASILIENSGTYSVEVININGCVAKDTVDVTIIGDAPVLAIDFPQYACLNTVFSFEDESSTVDGSILTSWTWEMGDGNTFTSPTATHSYNEGGSYEVNYAIGTSSGCFMDTTFTVEVRNNPILTLSSNGACQNSSIQFYGGQLTPFTISDWRWDFGDNTPQVSGQNVTHEFTSHGEFEVLLIGTDNYGCIDTVSSAKFISPIPNVDFTYNEICEGKVVNFQNESSIASPSTISNYYWIFGDGNSSGQIHPQKPYITYGEYLVSLTAVSNDGCNASKDTILKVHAVPSVDYSIEQACAGLSTMLKDQSFVADGSVAQVDWSIQGAPAISGFSVEKTFDYVGTYHLKQTVKSAFGCSQTEESLFEIHEALKADFSFYPNAFIVNEPTVFINETVGGTDFHWTFGDFASAQQADTSIVFTEDQLGEEITVQLWAKNDNNCMDSVSVSKEVIGRETDLSVSEIFTQKEDGFLTIGVRLKNKGSTPIENVELTLQKSGNILLKEIWTGELQANEEEIYVFSAALSAFIAIEDSATQFICIRGRILNTSFPETDLSNNESCLHLGNPQNVIIQAFPNPARNQLKLRFLMPFEENASLMMYDSDGRLIQNIFEDKTLDEGLNTIELEVSHLASGNYIILYRGENQVQSKRIIVVN